jgi:hypothetical protein
LLAYDEATGEPAANVEVCIVEEATGDKACGTTDDAGRFTITVADDTMHHIFVNGELSGKVKVITR